MIWVIIVAIIVFIAFKIGSTSGQVVGSVSSNQWWNASEVCKTLGEHSWRTSRL